MFPRIIIITLFFFGISFQGSFAAEKESSTQDDGVHKTAPHPPHDHHDSDHLKHIRGHGQKKKKISL